MLGAMDTFPDLGSLSDQELKDLIQQLTDEEQEVSYRRRILHGKIDILRAELVNRLRKKHEGGEDVISGADVQRLTDILAFGLLANAVCAVWLLRSDGNFRRIATLLAVVWFAVNGIGLYSASFDGSAFPWKRDMEIRRAATAGFLATGDQRYLDSAPPYGDAKRLAALLADPTLRSILPVGIRAPLAAHARIPGRHQHAGCRASDGRSVDYARAVLPLRADSALDPI